MPKRSIALLLLITMTLGPASGVFGGVMDKIRGYPLVQKLLGDSWINLWYTSQNQDIANYATAVGNAASKSLGNKAVVAYGKIGPDDEKITFRDNDTGEVTAVYDLVCSPPRVLLHRYGVYSAEVRGSAGRSLFFQSRGRME
jgi:hypothetical protein